MDKHHEMDTEIVMGDSYVQDCNGTIGLCSNLEGDDKYPNLNTTIEIEPTEDQLVGSNKNDPVKFDEQVGMNRSPDGADIVKDWLEYWICKPFKEMAGKLLGPIVEYFYSRNCSVTSTTSGSFILCFRARNLTTLNDMKRQLKNGVLSKEISSLFAEIIFPDNPNQIHLTVRELNPKSTYEHVISEIGMVVDSHQCAKILNQFGIGTSATEELDFKIVAERLTDSDVKLPPIGTLLKLRVVLSDIGADVAASIVEEFVDLIQKKLVDDFLDDEDNVIEADVHSLDALNILKEFRNHCLCDVPSQDQYIKYWDVSETRCFGLFCPSCKCEFLCENIVQKYGKLEEENEKEMEGGASKYGAMELSFSEEHCIEPHRTKIDDMRVLKAGDHITWDNNNYECNHAIIENVRIDGALILLRLERRADESYEIIRGTFEGDVRQDNMFVIQYPSQILKCNPPRLVLERAICRIGETGPSSDCESSESFVRHCKYGVAESFQIAYAQAQIRCFLVEQCTGLREDGGAVRPPTFYLASTSITQSRIEAIKTKLSNFSRNHTACIILMRGGVIISDFFYFRKQSVSELPFTKCVDGTGIYLGEGVIEARNEEGGIDDSHDIQGP